MQSCVQGCEVEMVAIRCQVVTHGTVLYVSHFSFMIFLADLVHAPFRL